MEITPRESVPMPELPLPLGEMVTLADATSGDGDIFTITLGLDDALIAEFKRRSCDTTDTELMKFTSDHARMCEGSYEAWYAKERYPFALVHQSGALAGLIWLGPKEFPELAEGEAPLGEHWDTFAIRLYPPFRGKRLATGFASCALKMYRNFQGNRRIWLDSHTENVGALVLYKKLGFEEVGYTKDHHRLAMIQK